MKVKRRKRILLLITNEFAALNVIHSGLINELAHTYDIHILSNFIKVGEISEINARLGTDIQHLDRPLPTETRLIKTLRWVEKAVFFYHFQIKTQQIKELDETGILKYLRKSILFITSLLNINLFILRILRKIIIRPSRNASMKRDLLDLRFDGVISSSPFDIRENQVVNDLALPALALVISWDNLTTKGLINANHDHLLVWNKFMAEEYEKFHKPVSLNEEKVHITGIPRFDLYFRPETSRRTDSDFKATFGMEPQDKFILFATSAVKHFPNQIDIVNHLVAYTRDKPNLKIIVRCHPGDNPSRYHILKKHSHVKIWASAPVNSSCSEQLAPYSPLLSLAEMLQCCQVCVHVASTLRLDAAACNRPVISVAYDGDLVLPYRSSVARLYAYSHQIPLNKLNIDVMVFSKSQLYAALDATLFETPPAQPNYRNRVKEFIHFTEPDSIRATMNVLREWLR
jgi:hypothetical protein